MCTIWYEVAPQLAKDKCADKIHQVISYLKKSEDITCLAEQLRRLEEKLGDQKHLLAIIVQQNIQEIVPDNFLRTRKPALQNLWKLAY